MNKKLLAKLFSLILVFSVISGCSAKESKPNITDGKYEATTSGMHGELSISMVVENGSVSFIQVDHQDTPGIADQAVNSVMLEFMDNQTIGVDTVTGATITSSAFLRAVEDCLVQANANMEIFGDDAPAKKYEQELSADVIIVGGGGAGLAAAASASEAGASVILIEKAGFLGGNSIVAGGIYNAPDPSKQDVAKNVSGDLGSLIEFAVNEKAVSEEHEELMATVKAQYDEFLTSNRAIFDSPEWFALQTWNGGDKVGDLNMVQIMADNALPSLKWLESLGMEFNQEISHGGGSLYPRTHGSVAPNGTGFINAYNNALANSENVKILYDTNGTELIMDGDKVVGVTATNKDGSILTLNSKNGVVLATGGFAGNVELRQEYCEGEKWPDLGADVITSNMSSVTGDGIFMAQDAGAKLVSMDQIQLLPYCNPTTGATYDIVTVDVFINQEGERFVREDGRRDEMSKAIIEQTGSIMYSIFSADTVQDPATTHSLGGKTLEYYLENNVSGYVGAPTLEELAVLIDVPAEALVQSIAEFNDYVDAGVEDEFGRVSYSSKIETGPFYAYPRKPAVHHTMGGVNIDESTHVLNDNDMPISGLYAAGEITGNIHGANRLGGNAIVDFAVFGQLAGIAAASGE